jgi:serine protease Do
VQDVTQEMAEAFGLDKPTGALVVKVDKNSPAEKAGLKAGDVVLMVDNQAINRSTDLPAYIANQTPGQQVQLQLWRNKKTQPLVVTLGALEDNERPVARNDSEKKPAGKLGLGVRPLSPQEARSLGVTGGLVVEQVTGLAARAGLQVNDVILAANDEPVSSVEQLRGLVDKARKVIALLVLRGDSQIFVPVPLAN